MFAIATREKMRFSTSKGDLSVEQLWDLPCISDKGPSLKEIAQDLITQIKPFAGVLEDEFAELVAPDTDHNYAIKRKLEIVKYIYRTKTEERKASVIRAEERNNNQLILEILEIKKLEELKQLSVEELMRKLK